MFMNKEKEKQILEMLEDINEKLGVISSSMEQSPERSEIIQYKEELQQIHSKLQKNEAGVNNNLLLFKND